MWHLYFYISCLILKASFHTSPRLSSTVKYVQRFFFFKIKHYTYEITQFPFMEILFSIYGNDATVIMHLDWFLMLTSCILWLIVEVTFYTADVLLKFSTVYPLSANWGIVIKWINKRNYWYVKLVHFIMEVMLKSFEYILDQLRLNCKFLVLALPRIQAQWINK